MIKVEELRIGNYVTDKNGRDVVVYDIQKYGINQDEFRGETVYDLMADDIMGVPLTEEWLLRLGFEKLDRKWKDGSVSKDMFNMSDYRFEYYISFTIDGVAFFRVGKNARQEQEYLRDIKWVHQLQNLYFALSGSELEYCGDKK